MENRSSERAREGRKRSTLCAIYRFLLHGCLILCIMSVVRQLADDAVATASPYSTLYYGSVPNLSCDAARGFPYSKLQLRLFL